jgi:hypothetical protein
VFVSETLLLAASAEANPLFSFYFVVAS